MTIHRMIDAVYVFMFALVVAFFIYIRISDYSDLGVFEIVGSAIVLIAIMRRIVLCARLSSAGKFQPMSGRYSTLLRYRIDDDEVREHRSFRATIRPGLYHVKIEKWLNEALRSHRNSPSFSNGPYLHLYATVADRKLKGTVPNLIFDNRSLGNMRTKDLRKTERDTQLESYFSARVRVYRPQHYDLEIYQLLTPPVLEIINEILQTYDIELIDQRLYVVGSLLSQRSANEMAELADRLMHALNHELKDFDPISGRPTEGIALPESSAKSQRIIAQHATRLKDHTIGKPVQTYGSALGLPLAMLFFVGFTLIYPYELYISGNLGIFGIQEIIAFLFFGVGVLGFCVFISIYGLITGIKAFHSDLIARQTEEHALLDARLAPAKRYIDRKNPALRTTLLILRCVALIALVAVLILSALVS